MRRLSRIILTATFFLVMIYPWYSFLLPSQNVSGVFEESGRPDLTVKGVLDGSFQTAAETFFREHLPGRSAMIKAKNQFVVNAFSKSPVDGVLIGKNQQLFTPSFIRLWYQLSGPTTDEFIEELANTIQKFNNLMKKQDIQTVIYITPTKARFYPDDIPDIYRFAASEHPEATAYEKLIKALRPLNIPTFDSITYLEANSSNGFLNGYPLFAKTGTHWSQSTGAMVAYAFGEFLKSSCGYQLPEMSINIEPVGEPEYPDADIFDILNIYTKPYDQYTKPVFTITDPGKNLPGMLCRGGSFMGQSMAHLVRQGYFSKDIWMENTMLFEEKFTKLRNFSDYSEVDLKESFKDIDLVILEVNEISIDVMSFGFMDYVLEHQDEIFP